MIGGVARAARLRRFIWIGWLIRQRLEQEPEYQVDITASDIDRMKRLDLALLRGKVYVLPGVRRFVSAVNSEEDIAWTVDALDAACQAVARLS